MARSADMSKLEAVRRAQAKLGKKAKPMEIQEFVKSNFKIDMTTSMISSYKTFLKSKRSGGAQKAKVGRPKASAGAVTISVDDIRAVKELADRIGAQKIKELAEVLSK